jgi:hypothetical protein
MKLILSLIVTILSSLTMFCQSYMKVFSSKLTDRFDVITPIKNNVFEYEKYNYFKHKYWLLGKYSVVIENDSILKNDSITINLKDSYISYASCDTLINYIKNSYVHNISYYAIQDSIRIYLGYDNKEFKMFLVNNQITNRTLYQVCYPDFIELDSVWRNLSLNKIIEISKKKKERLNWIVKNKDKINESYILSFLQDFSICSSDFESIVSLMTFQPDSFINSCKKISDTDFYTVKHKLIDVSNQVEVEAAIIALRDSKIFSKRKKILIRKLKKSTR